MPPLPTNAAPFPDRAQAVGESRVTGPPPPVVHRARMSITIRAPIRMIRLPRTGLTGAPVGNSVGTSMKEPAWRRPPASGGVFDSRHARAWQPLPQRRPQGGEPDGQRRPLRDPRVRVVPDLGRPLHSGTHPVGAARS